MMTPAVVDESWAPGAAVRGMPSVSPTVVVVASSLVNRLRRIGGRRQQERVFEKIWIDRPGEGGRKKAELFRRLIGVELQWPRILLTPPLLLPPLLLHDVRALASYSLCRDRNSPFPDCRSLRIRALWILRRKIGVAIMLMMMVGFADFSSGGRIIKKCPGIAVKLFWPPCPSETTTRLLLGLMLLAAAAGVFERNIFQWWLNLYWCLTWAWHESVEGLREKNW